MRDLDMDMLQSSLQLKSIALARGNKLVKSCLYAVTVAIMFKVRSTMKVCFTK